MKHLYRLCLLLLLTLLPLALAACGGDETPPPTPEDPACAHVQTTLRNAAEPSCTQTGYSGDTVCTACETTVQTGRSLPKTDCVIVHTGVITAAPTCEQNGSA